MKPEEPGLPLQKSFSEQLGYFSADLFAWLVFFSLFHNNNFYGITSREFIDCGTLVQVLGVMQKEKIML